MTNMTNLDIDRFRKVYALVKDGATEGERAAAEARATEIAEKAGMTLAEAVALCEGCNPSSPTDRVDLWKRFFEELAKDPEFRKGREERERRDAARRAQLLKEYGSEEAILEETEREKLLSAAVEHLKEWEEYVDEATGEVHRYASNISGYKCFARIHDIAPSTLDAVANAYPVPDDLNGVLEEYRYWDKLYVDRQLFEPVEHWSWVEVRVRLLENILDTRPVQSWQDMQARMEWWQIIIDWGMHHPDGWEQNFHDRVVADLAILQGMFGVHVQSGQRINQHRTNADKRHQVTKLLRMYPDLSNREIARRAGVSPQTVVKRLHRKIDKYPFDVISPDGRKWIEELWPLAVEEIQKRKTTLPVKQATEALTEFKKTRKEMTVQMEVCWLADHFPDLSQAQMALVLSVSQPLVSRNLAIRKRQRDWARALKNRELEDQAPIRPGGPIEASTFWDDGLLVANADHHDHDRHIQKSITSSKMTILHSSVSGVAASV